MFYTFTLLEGDRFLSPFMYPAAVLQTFLVLLKERPISLIVQNPSIVLSFFCFDETNFLLPPSYRFT